MNNDIFYTVPSFTINKKEFLTLWVKNQLITFNKRIADEIKGENDADILNFLLAFGVIKLDLQEEQQNPDDKISTIEFRSQKVWTLNQNEILDLKFLLGLLTLICPTDFGFSCSSFEELKQLDIDQLIVFDEIVQ